MLTKWPLNGGKDYRKLLVVTSEKMTATAQLRGDLSRDSSAVIQGNNFRDFGKSPLTNGG